MFLLLFAGAPDPGYAQTDLVSGAEERVSEVSRNHEAAVVDLMLLEDRLAAARTKLARAEENLTALESRLAEAESRREKAVADLGKVEARLGVRLEESYKAGGIGWLDLLFSSEDLGDFVNRAQLLGRVVESEAQLREQILAKRAEIELYVTELEEARDRQAQALKELEASRLELEAATGRHEALVAALGDKLAAARAELQAAREKMEQINREARSRRQTPSREEDRGSRGGDSEDSGAGSLAEPTAGGSGGPTEAAAPSGGRQIKAKVTAYALRGTTATGVRVRRGIIAVDPSVIPLGTRLYVPGYGEGIAADTGSAVKGNVVDVWLPSYQEALDWGIKYLTITVYD
ncbi:MAG: 3D domain-containing protein [Thermoleophilia bacterium]